MTLKDRKTSYKDLDASLFGSEKVGSRSAQSWLAEQLKRGESGIFSLIISLEPDLAELLLARNPNNRPVRQYSLANYSTDILSGSWEMNGEAIKVSRCGFLNDGQHRCLAVLRTGMPIQTMIIFGLVRETRTTVDKGGAKTVGDYLGMDGVENSNVSAAVAGMVWQYEVAGRISRQSYYRPTKAQVVATFREHPEISESIRAARHKGTALVGGISTLAFCHYTFAKKNEKAADIFVEKLAKGDGLSVSSPIYRCRERLLANRRMTPEEKVELIFRTWNAFRKNRQFDSKSSPLKGKLPPVED